MTEFVKGDRVRMLDPFFKGAKGTIEISEPAAVEVLVHLPDFLPPRWWLGRDLIEKLEEGER